ncbi:hypothetical protein AB1Y20_001808 [Prymnesium parvum]|uniref:MalT-like TPR region domain-containing protein n=1 Tax=Prymnesium parvum TaxID=97485 RepID=A0AB34KBW0_PRYPA
MLRAASLLARRRPALLIGAGLAALSSSSSSPPRHSSCDAPPADPHLAPPPPPPAILDDPEYNAQVLERWRGRIAAARAQWRALDAAAAEATLRLALDDAAHFGAQSAPMATSYLNLAQLYAQAGRHGEAAPLLERAAAVLETNAGPNNKVTLLALLDLAAARHALGDAARAEEGYEEVLCRLRLAEEQQAHGRASIRDVRAGCLLRVAAVKVELGKLEQAEAQLREAIDLTQERWGEDSSRLAAPRSELAKVLLAQQRASEAAEQCERALRVSKRPAQREQLEALRGKIAAVV